MNAQVGEKVFIRPSAVEVLEATVTKILDFDQYDVETRASNIPCVVDREMVFPFTEYGRRTLIRQMREDIRYIEKEIASLEKMEIEPEAAALMDEIQPTEGESN